MITHIEAQMEKETKRYEKRLRKNAMMKTEEAEEIEIETKAREH